MKDQIDRRNEGEKKLLHFLARYLCEVEIHLFLNDVGDEEGARPLYLMGN
jgi:hypothetical protein